MKAIVFGGAGFLGSHVADALLAAGHQVTVFDRRPSDYLQRGMRQRLGDIEDPNAVREAVKGQALVYNFAGFADIEAARDKPLETIRSNIWGNGVILDAARQHRVKRYVFASSVYVYSSGGSFYRASKQACEAYIEGYQSVFGLPFTILRFGSLYGPRSDRRNGLYRMVHSAVAKKKIDYWGTGEEVREYIHVRDAALSSVDILAPEFENQHVILTGQQSTKVKDVLTMIREMMGNRVAVHYRKNSRPALRELHYAVTPYAFLPREGRKLVRAHHVDLGQGLLSLLSEAYGSQGPSPTMIGGKKR